MEDSLTPDTAVRTTACPNCGQPAMEGDHPTPLCEDCRTQFIRTPIPLWIRLFAAAVLLVLLFSLYTLPANLSIGIRMEKGKRAEAAHKYITAEKELKAVVAKLPDNADANEMLMIADYYNQDLDAFYKIFERVKDKKVDDNDLFSQVSEVMGKAAVYLPTDSFNNFTAIHPDSLATPDTAWKRYFAHNPDDALAGLIYASQLFDSSRYTLCDSIVGTILTAHSDFFPALMLGASVKREEGKYDQALRYNQRILELNRESVPGLASEARTLLRLKQDAEALDLALQAHRIDDRSSYADASLILAYHFNDKKDERDALIRKATQEADKPGDKKAVQYALDVIAKKERFRD